jgi:hypothetical protein
MIFNLNFKTLPFVAKFVCILAFSVHTGINMWTNILKEKMLVEEKSVELSTIPFPVVFDISISPGMNITELNRLGFENPLFYFTGINRFNHSAFGWNGGFENGTFLKNASGIVYFFSVVYIIFIG